MWSNEDVLKSDNCTQGHLRASNCLIKYRLNNTCKVVLRLIAIFTKPLLQATVTYTINTKMQTHYNKIVNL